MKKKSQNSAEIMTKTWEQINATFWRIPYSRSGNTIVASFLLKTLLFQKIEIFSYFFIEICVVAFQYLNLMLIWFTIHSLNENSEAASIITLIFGVFCISSAISFLTSSMHYIQGVSVSNIKTAINCTLAKKVLERNSNLDIIKNNSSKAINIDIAVIQKCIFDLISIISGIIDITISVIILFCIFGINSLFAVLIFALLLFANAVILKMRQKIQRKFRKFTETRLCILSDTLKAIKFIKMSALEEMFEKKVGNSRSDEIGELQNNSFLISLQTIFRIIAPMIAITGTMNICSHFEECHLNSGKILITISIIYSTASRLLFFFNDFLDFMHAIDAVKAYAELWKSENAIEKKEKMGEIKKCVSMQNCCFTWNQKTSKINALSSLNFDIKMGELIIINGKVGSGKSTLLSAIHGNLKLTNGNFLNTFQRSIFVPQSAWLCKGTWEENIVFDRKFNKYRLKKVIECCALQDEMAANFENEITTNVSNVSGGQRARIALARAIYNFGNADLFLFDDTLASLDNKTARHIFDSVIGPNGILEGRTRILVTNSAEFLKEADQVFTMKDGKIYENNNIIEDDHENAILDIYPDKPEIEPSSKKPQKLLYKTEFCNQKDLHDIFRLPNFNIFCFSFFAIFVAIFVQTMNFFFFEFVLLFIYFCFLRNFKVLQSNCNHFLTMIKNLLENFVSKFIPQKTKNAHLFYYLKIFGPWKAFSYISLQLFFVAGIDAGIWITVLNDPEQKSNLAFSIFIKIMLIGISHYIYVRRISNASILFHKLLASSILNSSLHFFQNTRFSELMCLFTNDMEEIDVTIPEALSEITLDAFKISIFFFTISTIFLEYSRVLLIIPFLVTVILIVLIQKCQKSFTHGKLKILQRNKYKAWNCVLGFLDETIKGATVIQSCQTERNYIKQFANFFDNFNSFEILEFQCKRNFVLLIDFIANFSTFLLLLIFVMIQRNFDERFKSNLGLLITCSLSFSETIRRLTNQCTILESGLASIKILKKFINLQQETYGEISKLHQQNSISNIPGKICFRNFCFQYSDNSDTTLKNINCTIKAGEKIGIVGRTGAGKSSIFNAILRLFNKGKMEGCIYLDGIPIYEMELKTLRKRIGIIPQGERQLISMARILLNKNAIDILLIDEGTAGVDQETDNLVQEALQKSFSNHTVLIIAHRFETIKKCDRIAVMNEGELVEMDTPENLFKNHNSAFSSLFSSYYS